MNRKTTILLATFVALLLVVAAVRLWPRGSAGPDLRIPGWGTGAKVEKSEEEGPIDRITVAAEGTVTTLKRVDKGRWSLEPPQGARADRYKVRQILDAFREGVTSVVSSRAEAQDLAAFGLDDTNRVAVTLHQGDSVVAALEIGAVQKPEDGVGDGDTFVREPGSDRVYRVIGRDLRRPFEGGVKGLRDKRVHDWESGDVAAITIRNPRAAAEADRLIVLKSEPKPEVQEPKAEGGAVEKKAEKPEREWRFETPAGLRAGNVKSYAATLASLYAQEYADTLPEGVRIGDDALRIEVGLADGRTVRMAVSDVKDESAFVQVEGLPGYAKVSKYTAESLAKRVADLRDKTLFGVKRDEVRQVRIVDGVSRVEVALVDGAWRAVSPAGWPVGKAPMDTLLRDIETLAAKDILGPDQVRGVDTGLGSPAATVLVTTREGVTKTLRIGRELEKEKGTFYAAMSGSDEVFTLAQWMAQKVRKGVKDLRNKLVFDFPPERIRTIEVVHADETMRLERIEGEGQRFRATAPTEASDLKEDPVRTLVHTLSGLTAKDLAEGKTPAAVGLAGKPRVEVTVTLDDGSRHVLRVSEQNQSGDPYAETPTEPAMRGAVFLLNQYQVRNFDKRLSELR